MTYNTGKRKVFVDLDGVVFDFGSARDASGLPSDQFKLQKHAYRHLKPYPGAIEAVRRIIAAGFDVWIATKIPTDNPYAATDKILSINEYLPELRKSIIITPNKGTLGDEMDFIVDDRPHKAHVEEFKGKIYRFGHHNEYKTWDAVLKDLLTFPTDRIKVWEYGGCRYPIRTHLDSTNFAYDIIKWHDCDESMTIVLDDLLRDVGMEYEIEERNNGTSIGVSMFRLHLAMEDGKPISTR